jgi:tetratricopeptide (TPR) repeat protein
LKKPALKQLRLLLVFGLLIAANCAMVRTPTTASGYLDRGIARGGKGDLDGAIADFSRAIELSPQHAPAYYNRGIARSDKGDLDGAIADYNKAIALDAKDGDAYNNRGLARSDKGDLDGAIADYTKPTIIAVMPVDRRETWPKQLLTTKRG